jgi:short-subunit dehydrogenase
MKRALISGASSGIGEAFAKALVQEGYDCVVFARRMDRLLDLQSTCHAIRENSLFPIQLDAYQSDALDVLESHILAHEWTFDLVINNAGFGYVGEFASMNEQTMSDMVYLNCTFLTLLTRRLVAYMNPQGTFLHVSSLAGEMSGPNMNVYYASKNYVSAFSLACDIEFKSLGLRSLAFIPGPVHTEFGRVAKAGPMKVFNHVPSMNVDKAVQNALKGLSKRQRFICSQPSHHMLIWIVKSLPKVWVAKVVAKLQSGR